MIEPGPICERCTRTWDERLGYCEQCAHEMAQERNIPNGGGLLEDNFS
jgi:predicted amidophosphoribosyltransferase